MDWSVGDGEPLALFENTAQHLPEPIEGLRYPRITQAVVDGLPLSSGDDQPLVAQGSEMLGEIALAQTETLDQLAHRAGAVP